MTIFFELNIYSEDIIQMDDGVIILENSLKKEITLVDIKGKNIEIINSNKLNVWLFKLVKLSNRKILIYSKKRRMQMK